MLTGLLRQFDIRTRMLGAIAVVLVLLALLGGAGLWSLQRMAALGDTFETTVHADAVRVADLRMAYGNLRRYEKDLILSYEKADQVAAYKPKWQAAAQQLRERAAALAQAHDGPVAEHARKMEAMAATYLEKATPVMRQVEASAYDNATVANRQLKAAKDAVHQVEVELDALAKVLADMASASHAEREALAARARWIFLAAVIIAVAVVVPLTLANMVSICRPIDAARGLAERIATGDLTTRVHDDGADEAARLVRSIHDMQESLRRIVTQVHSSAESIQVAAAQVASGNQDLSGRTEQTASRLQQTASAMEELTGTVRQSAESANQANQLAGNTSTAAEHGGEVVTQVVRTMEEISASSHRIADIIGTIDGIAFQTNILALNAAVEAARAGELGRGFAVVAGEVRSLAQRSATAAQEIKTLIGTSVERVEAGSRLVQDAGTAMADIVGGVHRVSQIIGEISLAAGQQSAGIGQVNGSVSELDQMTQQNAALVEQAAAAADALKDQSRELARVVAGFRLEAHA